MKITVRSPSFRKVFQRLFEEVVQRCVEKELVSGKLMAIDSIHVKANVSCASEHLVRDTGGAGGLLGAVERL